jgi:hypothetical protein
VQPVRQRWRCAPSSSPIAALWFTPFGGAAPGLARSGSRGSVRFGLAAGFVAGLVAGCARGPRLPAADVLFYDARIYTLAGAPPANIASEPLAAALAVRDGRIVAIGSETSVRGVVD